MSAFVLELWKCKLYVTIFSAKGKAFSSIPGMVKLHKVVPMAHYRYDSEISFFGPRYQ